VHHHGRYNSIRYLSFSSLVAFRYDFTTPASALMHAGFVNGSGFY
jgi:hypothetical protein